MAGKIDKILEEIAALTQSERSKLINAILAKYFLPKSEEEESNDTDDTKEEK